MRLTDTGAPDLNFGAGDGISPIEGSADRPGLEIDPANRPLVHVRRSTALFRFDRHGNRLAGFGIDGVRELEQGSLDLVERSGATIISYGQGRGAVVIRLKPNGSRDLGFGGSGAARVALPPRAHVSPVAVDDKGRILLAGYIGSGERRSAGHPQRTTSFAVGRLLTNGRLDRSFGKRGWVISPFARPLRLTSATADLDSRGRLLVAGTVVAPGHPRGGFVLARYLLGP